jgi:glycosyltransferase involved in cell wall biosynthesis
MATGLPSSQETHGSGPVLMFLGKLVEVKRVDIAIEVVRALDIPVSLLVIGDGSVRRHLENQFLPA